MTGSHYGGAFGRRERDSEGQGASEFEHQHVLVNDKGTVLEVHVGDQCTTVLGEFR